jgi:hypothetical protein
MPDDDEEPEPAVRRRRAARAEDDFDEREFRRPPRRRRKHTSGSRGLVMGLIGVGVAVLLLVGGVVAVVAYSRNKEPQEQTVAQAPNAGNPAPAPLVPPLRVGRPPVGQPPVGQPPEGRPPVLGPNTGNPSAPPPTSGQSPAGEKKEVGTRVGLTALEIEGEDIDGKRFKLSDYRGKVVLLDFWGNW